jgi:hypothetical protein
VEPRATPEEAARGDVPAEFVKVIAVVVRGDEAIVAQLMNESEPDTSHCVRKGGGWVEQSSGNFDAAFMGVENGVGTVVTWRDEAPTWAVAAKYEVGAREKVVPVENGCVAATFDGVPENSWPRLAVWIDARGAEYPFEGAPR